MPRRKSIPRRESAGSAARPKQRLPDGGRRTDRNHGHGWLPM
jgi:hypothetical protein